MGDIQDGKVSTKPRKNSFGAYPICCVRHGTQAFTQLVEMPASATYRTVPASVKANSSLAAATHALLTDV